MYYSKLSNAFSSIRDIAEKYPTLPDGFAKQRPEWEIVGAFASDPLSIARIESGTGGTAGPVITVTTVLEHGFNEGTPIKINGVGLTMVLMTITSQQKFSLSLMQIPLHICYHSFNQTSLQYLM